MLKEAAAPQPGQDGANYSTLRAPVPVPAPASAPSPLQMTEADWESVKQGRPKVTSSFIYRPATVADAAQIAQIGVAVFTSTFGYSMPPADLEAYLQETYTTEIIENDIADPNKHFIVPCPESDPSTVLGFVQLKEHSTDPAVAHLPQDTLVELQRLYVAQEAHGKGLGKALIEAAEAKAREMGYVNIWLGVWEENFIAQKVYTKVGYKKVGDHPFKMGECVQIDWIMAKPL